MLCRRNSEEEIKATSHSKQKKRHTKLLHSRWSQKYTMYHWTDSRSACSASKPWTSPVCVHIGPGYFPTLSVFMLTGFNRSLKFLYASRLKHEHYSIHRPKELTNSLIFSDSEKEWREKNRDEFYYFYIWHTNLRWNMGYWNPAVDEVKTAWQVNLFTPYCVLFRANDCYFLME